MNTHALIPGAPDPVGQMIRILERYDGCIRVLTLAGHGAGYTGIPTGSETLNPIDPSRLTAAQAAKITAKLCKGAIVRSCGCDDGSDPNEMQRAANSLRRRFCACNGRVSWGGDNNMACRCEGQWLCVNPN